MEVSQNAPCEARNKDLPIVPLQSLYFEEHPQLQEAPRSLTQDRPNQQRALERWVSLLKKKYSSPYIIPYDPPPPFEELRLYDGGLQKLGPHWDLVMFQGSGGVDP